MASLGSSPVDFPPLLSESVVNDAVAAAATAAAPSASPSDAPKKKRRRLRVSCVECTRRRQKCDRQQPCGLCKSRGVSHLCFWATEPFSRPPPARPPNTRATSQSTKKTIPALQIASISTSTASAQVPGPSRAAYSSSQATASSRRVAVNQDVKEAAIALAQLSVAKRGEYLGTGSLVSALHKLDGSFVQESPLDEKLHGFPFFPRALDSFTLSRGCASSLESLISGFPDRRRCDALLPDYFEHENWLVGIPKSIIYGVYNTMWDKLESDQKYIRRLNCHWATLLFAMLALSSACSSEEESRRYFLQAITARRLAEDLHSVAFVSGQPALPSDGAEYASLGAALLSKYMMDRGQMTEAWKLVGSALRDAQNAGLHRKPSTRRWHNMTEDERVLRLLSWHLLALCDKFLSVILGRPVAIRMRDVDCPLPHVPKELEMDGSSDTAVIFQAIMYELYNAMSEAKDIFLCVRPDRSDGKDAFDARITEFESWLPAYFATSQRMDTSYDYLYPKLSLLRLFILGSKELGRLFFHRSLPTIQLSLSRPSSAAGTLPSTPTTVSSNEVAGGSSWDSDALAERSIGILRSQTSLLQQMWWKRQVCVSSNYLIFEGAVTLSIILLRTPNHPRAREWANECAATITLYEHIRDHDFGEIGPQAIKVLQILQDSYKREMALLSRQPEVRNDHKPKTHDWRCVSQHVQVKPEEGAYANVGRRYGIPNAADGSSACPNVPPLPVQAATAGVPMHTSQPLMVHDYWAQLELMIPEPAGRQAVLPGIGWIASMRPLEHVEETEIDRHATDSYDLLHAAV